MPWKDPDGYGIARRLRHREPCEIKELRERLYKRLRAEQRTARGLSIEGNKVDKLGLKRLCAGRHPLQGRQALRLPKARKSLSAREADDIRHASDYTIRPASIWIRLLQRVASVASWVTTKTVVR